MQANRIQTPLQHIAMTTNMYNDIPNNQLSAAIQKSWLTIAPFWPLENLIAINPLQGLESLPIEDALIEASSYFQRHDLPDAMRDINRETIKWLQSFFDEGQSTVPMPLRKNGLYAAWRQLARFDTRLHGNKSAQKTWLAELSQNPETTIATCLKVLQIPEGQQTQFLTLLLTTLPGWAAHIQYRISYTDPENPHPYPVTASGYLALRIAITCLLWPEAAQLLTWHSSAKKEVREKPSHLHTMMQNEALYHAPMLDQIAITTPVSTNKSVPDAQLVFCIDVRSEPFRKALESTGNYETFGFAGFFGVPVYIENSITEDRYPSCPVLLTPKHHVIESPICSQKQAQKERDGYEKLTTLKRLYQSVKYTFAAPFALVEMLGLACGVWMALRSFSPRLADSINKKVTSTIRPEHPVAPSLSDMSFSDQCAYGENALRMIGLTTNFSPRILFCGHGSSTQNNSYSTGLDCGACGGRHGASNARILAKILNDPTVRQALTAKGIVIPETTRFIAAEHNTTTDDVEIYTDGETVQAKSLRPLAADLLRAKHLNVVFRSAKMGYKGDAIGATKYTQIRSVDWAQVRPEWGLARNAAFIIGPRALTAKTDLDGRSFLHSYDWEEDAEGVWLTAILTAPVVVAQWINTQYLFSTLDNVAYGGGSKVTKNITGKFAIMQGNASDLMNGLPLQSVYKSDKEPYHHPARLMTLIYAPKSRIDAIIKQEAVLQKLFGNGWVLVTCLDPLDGKMYTLQRDFSWTIR
jgi:uncharacterized protein YbcC (UPF0753/DUF2309 family)